jgi:hypothetical protein
MLIYAMLQTIELWIFLGIMGAALIVEQLINRQRARNAEHQIRINAEIDRLHK